MAQSLSVEERKTVPAMDENINVAEICAVLGLGEPQGSPRVVTGGLLHQMLRLETNTDTYALKILNDEIMHRPEAKANYRVAERVAVLAERNGIPAVLAKVFEGEPWIERAGRHVMVFDWIEGESVEPDKCTEVHSRSIGGILAQLHNLYLQFDDVELPSRATIPKQTWDSHIATARQHLSCWGFPCETLLHKVMRWSQMYERVTQRLTDDWVLSHRDLDSKNVLWTRDQTPFLIDWESAGYIHPTVELVEVAMNWSRNKDGTCDKRRYQRLIQAYLKAGGEIYGDSLDTLYGTFEARLAWLEYNMRRSLNRSKFDSVEREMGTQQVRQTVNELNLAENIYPEYASWTDELR